MSYVNVQKPNQTQWIQKVRIKKYCLGLGVLYLEFPLSVFYQDFFHLVFVGQFFLLQYFDLYLILGGKERFLFQFLQLPCKFAVGLLCF